MKQERRDDVSALLLCTIFIVLLEHLGEGRSGGLLLGLAEAEVRDGKREPEAHPDKGHKPRGKFQKRSRRRRLHVTIVYPLQ